MFIKVFPIGNGGEATYIHVGDIAEIMPSLDGKGAEIRLRGEGAWVKVEEPPEKLLHRMGMKIV